MSRDIASFIVTACLGGLNWVLLLSASVLAAEVTAEASGDADQAAPPEAIAFFENKVRPLLIEHCYACHSADEDINGGLALDTRHGWVRGGDSGAAIVPGQPDKSLVMKAVRYEDVNYEMPPDGKLKDADIATLQRWIAMGAPDPRTDAPLTHPKPDSSTTATAADALWSFRPITKPAVPEVADPAWADEPIDAFVRARLGDAGLPPAPPADNRMLLRRLHLDLIGLPPTPDEIEAFDRRCDQDRTAAIAEVVERLLASPEFGERWARHWLDLTAYADTLGVGRAIPAVEAYRYRDYVIGAFNDDKPLGEFIRQQIAGDVQVPGAPGQKSTPPPTAEDIIATGFLAIGPWELVSGDKEQLRMDVVDRQVNRIGKAFLGMTLECARCHAHKFDPVSQEDYFAIAGILRSSVTLHGRLNGVFSQVNHVRLPETSDELIERAEWIKQYEADLADAQRKVAEARREQMRLQTQVEKLKKQINKPGSPRPASGKGAEGEGASRDDTSEAVQVDELSRHLQVAEKELAAAKVASAKANKRFQSLEYLRRHRTERLAIAMSDRPEPEPAAINIRGNAHQLGDSVPRGFLRSVAPTNEPRLKIGTSGRLDLAEWIAHRDNPLTTRVWVNRIWHHLFGTGLVRTVDNFGSTGERPSHPELLDYLAGEFQKNGSTKQLIRRIVLSQAWQQSSINSLARAAGADDIDPNNRLLWRAHRKRMDAEVLHDSLLLVSGQLDRGHHGGPSLPLEHDDNLTPNATGTAIKNLRIPETWRGRRAIFQPQRRADPFDEVSFSAAFDLPSTNSETGMRTATALPGQTLNLVNSNFMQRQAAALADRLAAHAPARRIGKLYETVYGRQPSEDESQSALRWVESIAAELAKLEKVATTGDDPGKETDPHREAWTRLCQALLMSNEFLFRT